MKYADTPKYHRTNTSPSIRREWIEMKSIGIVIIPPRSPSIRREWIEIQHQLVNYNENASPSIRREWIEILIAAG